MRSPCWWPLPESSVATLRHRVSLSSRLTDALPLPPLFQVKITQLVTFASCNEWGCALFFWVRAFAEAKRGRRAFCFGLAALHRAVRSWPMILHNRLSSEFPSWQLPDAHILMQGKEQQDDRTKAGAVKVKKNRLARQYMNRRGGFNRPLPAERTGEKVSSDNTPCSGRLTNARWLQSSFPSDTR